MSRIVLKVEVNSDLQTLASGDWRALSENTRYRLRIVDGDEGSDGGWTDLTEEDDNDTTV